MKVTSIIREVQIHENKKTLLFQAVLYCGEVNLTMCA